MDLCILFFQASCDLTVSFYFSNLLSTHQLNRLLDEGMTDSERSDLQDAEAICRRFLQWDLAESEADLCEGETKRRLGIVLGRMAVE